MLCNSVILAEKRKEEHFRGERCNTVAWKETATTKQKDNFDSSWQKQPPGQAGSSPATATQKSKRE